MTIHSHAGFISIIITIVQIIFAESAKFIIITATANKLKKKYFL